MVKQFLLSLVVCFLFSCAARNVATSKSQIQEYIDSAIIEKKDSVSITQKSIIITDSTEEVEITPIDSSKPVVIGEIKYFNAKVKLKKSRRHFVDSSKILSIQSTDNQLSTKKEVKKQVVEKKIEKKSNYLFYLWLLLIPFALWFIWRLWRK